MYTHFFFVHLAVLFLLEGTPERITVTGDKIARTIGESGTAR